MQEVSFEERCPHFRGGPIEGLHVLHTSPGKQIESLGVYTSFSITFGVIQCVMN